MRKKFTLSTKSAPWMQQAVKLFSAALLLCACHSGKTDGGTPATGSAGATVPSGSPDTELGSGKPAEADSLASLLKQWREDSTGCQHVRSFESFKRLLKGYALDRKNEDEILKVLGPPNAEEKYPGKSIVIYYFNSICRANKIVKGADRSMVGVSFDDQKRYLRYDPAIE